MPKVRFDAKEVEVPVGATLLDAALDHDIDLDHNCGGNCACSSCHVIVVEGMENLSAMDNDEEDMLDTAEGVTLTSRLACQARVKGDVRVTIPGRPGR
jgi:2Fe-2S ferredoxin